LRSVVIARALIQKYGKSRVMVAGHSLGGTKAMFVSDTLGLPCVAFNPGWSPLTKLESPGESPSKARPKIRAHLIDGDHIASALLCENDGAKVVKKLYAKTFTIAHDPLNFVRMKPLLVDNSSHRLQTKG
jgi:predicted esterase YcpF (UPF0227 family)